MPVVYEAVNQLCVPGCEDGLWYRLAIELLTNNSIEPHLYAAAMRDLLSKGRGKFRNLLLFGPTNCGKTFLLQPLCNLYKVFQNPARDKFGWVGADEAEVIVNDLRRSADLIQWDDFLHLLEGKTVNVSAPKNHFSKDVSIAKDTPIFATGKSAVKHIGKYNLSDDRETEIIAVRWKVFNFSRDHP